jgi:hypothetical protein
MFQLYLYDMKTWKDILTPTIESLTEDRVRVVLQVEGIEVGVLYFERAKKGWNTKPIRQNGWACVEAKVEGLYVYGGESATPKELVAWCQELISTSSELGTIPTSGHTQGKLL